MLELQSRPYDVTGCYGRPAALDQLADAAELSVRVAPDELLLLGECDLSAVNGGPVGLVIDLSAAFTVWTLSGEDRAEAFRRLSAIKLPSSGVVQGLVAHLPAKVIVRVDELVVIVSSSVSHHLRERVLTACADLEPSEPVEVRVEEVAPA